MNSTSLWRLVTLGPPHLLNADGRRVRCERRTLALLALLALEGGASRSRLAGLFWPETPETTSRNNLVHLLRRLDRTFPGLIASADRVTLGPHVETDLPPQPGEPHGLLLDGLNVQEWPDVHEWLLAARERLAVAEQDWWAQAAAQAEEAGDFPRAAWAARHLVTVAPLSEDAWRRLMRALYLSGDQAGALGAYEACRATLDRELHIVPMAETQALARTIARSEQALTAPPAPDRPAFTPTALVGREEAWAEMERAWARGQGVILSGDPGVGKTRLAVDFLDAHGGGMRFEGRPGDAGRLYATHARTYRQVLRAYPDLTLSGDDRAELSRILPELRGDDPAPPIDTDEARARFWEAKVHTLGQAVDRGLTRMIFDDVQFMDEASVEAGGFVFAQLGWGQPDAPYRTIHVIRRGELTPFQETLLQQLTAAHLVVVVHLEPLTSRDVDGLVAQAGLPADGDLAGRLHHFAGGNPFLLLETLRSLLDARAESGGASPAPLPERAAGLLRRRLERLSPRALQTARAAATLQSDFHLELIAQTLQAPVLDVMAAWEELVREQVVIGDRFAHDLIAEALRQATPSGVSRLLHRGAARALAAREDAEAARVAMHWHAGGDPLQAAPWFMQAGWSARRQGRPREAGALFRQAADASGDADPAGRYRALLAHADVLDLLGDPAAEAATGHLHHLARTPLERAQAWVQTLNLARRRGDEAAQDRARQAGQAALAAAEPGPDRAQVELNLHAP